MQVRPDNIRTDKEKGGGTLYDIGIYCINAARYLFGAEPTEVFAFSSANKKDPRFQEIDEMTSVLMRFPGGVLLKLRRGRRGQLSRGGHERRRATRPSLRVRLSHRALCHGQGQNTEANLSQTRSVCARAGVLLQLYS